MHESKLNGKNEKNNEEKTDKESEDKGNVKIGILPEK